MKFTSSEKKYDGKNINKYDEISQKSEPFVKNTMFSRSI